MYELERLVEGVPFEVLNQNPDSVWIGPGFAAVVAWSESVGVVSLIDKGVVGFNEFLYHRPETAGKRGKDGFVDDTLLGGVIGIIINRDQVIEGFDEFSFRLGGVEVGRRLRPLCFLFLSLSGAALGRSLFRSRLPRRVRPEGRPQRIFSRWQKGLRLSAGCTRADHIAWSCPVSFSVKSESKLRSSSWAIQLNEKRVFHLNRIICI
jgi:hypothetical protein